MMLGTIRSFSRLECGRTPKVVKESLLSIFAYQKWRRQFLIHFGINSDLLIVLFLRRQLCKCFYENPLGSLTFRHGVRSLCFANPKVQDRARPRQVLLPLQLRFAVIPSACFTSEPAKICEFANRLWIKLLAWPASLLIVALDLKLLFDFFAPKVVA